MITGRKLTAEEVAALESKSARKSAGGSRKLMAELYDSLMVEYNAGEYGEVTLGEGEHKITVRKHIVKAFERRNLSVEFKRGKHDTLKFKVVEPNPATGNVHTAVEDAPSTAVETPVATPKAKRTRKS